MSLDRWIGKIAVITGASVGIGAATTAELLKRGIQVVGLARNIDRLDRLAEQVKNYSGKFYPRKCDVTNDVEVKEVFEWIEDNFKGVHILINNAGIAERGTLIDGNPDVFRKTFETNVIGLCVCTQLAVRSMIKHNIDGQIIQINSVLGHVVPKKVLPIYNVYPATKFAVTGLCETLRQELKYKNHKSKIKVTSLSPGLVRTEFAGANDFVPDEYKAQYAARTGIKPIDIANGVLYVLSTPPEVQVNELTITPVDD